MFKDKYKRANERIPTEEAYARIMRRVSAEKTRRVHYAGVSRVAALAACFLIAFAAVGVYEKHEKSVRTDDIMPRGIVEQNVEPTLEEEAISEPVKDEAVQKSVKVSDFNTPKPNSTQRPKTQPDAEDKLRVEIKLNKSAGATLRTASGGGRAMMDTAVEVSVSEYYDYLGVNVADKVRVPEGYENLSPVSGQLESDSEGNFVNDSWSFMFQGADGAIGIETTKHLESVQMILEDAGYEKSNICGTPAVTIEDGSGYTAHVISDDVAYSVSAYGVDLSAVEELLISIVE